MTSLIIPTTSKNREYTQRVLNSIRELYPNTKEVEVVVEENDNVTLGTNYNNAVAKASGNKIILLHNDMIMKEGFVETMDKHITKGRITTYTRVEPPIFPDTYPGKYLLDCGSDLKTFDALKFKELSIKESLVPGGSQLFFGCMKEDYIGIDGHTFTMFCEDDDLHLRYNLLGFEKVVSSAHVYHFVSKTSRTQANSNNIEHASNKNFIRKWGSLNRTSPIKYDVGFKVIGCTPQLLEILEPWCSTILLQDAFKGVVADYLSTEQHTTRTNLADKIKTASNFALSNDVVVEIDATFFTQQDLQNLTQLPEILKFNGQVGKFQLGTLIITIERLTEYQHALIHL